MPNLGPTDPANPYLSRSSIGERRPNGNSMGALNDMRREQFPPPSPGMIPQEDALLNPYILQQQMDEVSFTPQQTRQPPEWVWFNEQPEHVQRAIISTAMNGMFSQDGPVHAKKPKEISSKRSELMKQIP